MLTTPSILALREQICAESPALSLAEWTAIESATLAPQRWSHADIDADGTAYLQYTSGSTSAPKGVIISHANIRANLQHFRLTVDEQATNVGITWMPHFHDFGLVWGLMHPLYEGRRGF